MNINLEEDLYFILSTSSKNIEAEPRMMKHLRNKKTKNKKITSLIIQDNNKHQGTQEIE